MWAEDQFGNRVEMPVGVPEGALVEWPPVPPALELFDFRALIDTTGFGQVPAAGEPAQYPLRYQGLGVRVGLNLAANVDAWELHISGQDRVVRHGESATLIDSRG